MKKVSMLLEVGILSLFLGIGNVSAFSFTAGNNEYIFEEREITCVNTVFPYLIDDDNLIFREGEYDFVRVDKDNKCTELKTSAEILDILNKEKHKNFMIDENYVVYEEVYDVRISGMIKTSDTLEVDGKTYYDYNNEVVENPDFSDSSASYYELVTFDYPTDSKLDSTVTYYKRDGNVYVKVDSPKEEEVYMYLVLSNEDDGIKTKKFTLDKTVFAPIFNNGFRHMDVYQSLDGVYYILVYSDDDTVDIYDVNGKFLFDDINYFMPYSGGLVGINKGNGVEIYNSNGELIYTLGNLDFLEEIYYDDFNGMMIGLNNLAGERFYYNYKVNKLVVEDKEVVDNTSNPKTSDNIVLYFVSGCLALIGLVVMIKYQLKNVNSNIK